MHFVVVVEMESLRLINGALMLLRDRSSLIQDETKQFWFPFDKFDQINPF